MTIATGSADATMLLNLAAGSLGTIGYPLAAGVAATALRAVARTAEATAQEAALIRSDDAVAARLHKHRQQRFADLRGTAVPLLQGLADGRFRPDDEQVRRSCRIEASRMRRLFAETDEGIADPLLHELRQCITMAERRDVVVDMQTRGSWPIPPLEIRRVLTDAPLAALATAATWARVTVAGLPDTLSVSVVADCGALELTEPAGGEVEILIARDRDTSWVEARWKAE